MMHLRAIPRFAWHFAAWSVAVSALAFIVLATLLFTTRSPLLMFDVVSEIVTQEVVRPDLSAIAVTDATVSGTAHCAKDGPFAGVIQAPTGSKITYRWQENEIAINFDLPADKPLRFEMAGEAECSEAAGRVSVRTEAIQANRPAWRLPVAGPTEVGSESALTVPGPDGQRRFDLLRGGSFEVFGRSFNWLAPGGLYPMTSEPVAIPAGSRIGSLEGSNGTGAIWFGTVTHSREGFVIAATAEARSVTLYRPGLVEQRERFEFGVFASIAGDQNLGIIFLVLVIFTSTAQLGAAWVGLWSLGRAGKR